ncbi:MAG: hypothetical protein IJW82_02355 [Clostridia bacterium]|nr:hypothetical protein [Clostridia bacterium]
MKNINKILLAVIVFVLSFCCVACKGKITTVTDAIFDIGVTIEEPFDKSKKYDLDERFKCFQSFSSNGQGWLHLKNETGLMAMIFSTKENQDGSVECELIEIYVKDYKDVGMGWVSNIEKIIEFVGEDITFTLVLENNIVTSKDLPTLK